MYLTAVKNRSIVYSCVICNVIVDSRYFLLETLLVAYQDLAHI